MSLNKYIVSVEEKCSADFVVEAHSEEEAYRLWTENCDRYDGIISSALNKGSEGWKIEVTKCPNEWNSDFTYTELTKYET